MNASIAALVCVPFLVTGLAAQSATRESDSPRIGSRRLVDVSLEGLGEASPRTSGGPSPAPLDCRESIADQATGGCLTASSVRTPGMLFPPPLDHGGTNNLSSGTDSFVGGGTGNTASGRNATVGGGISNTASGYYGSTVGGGQSNTASGRIATVGGGWFNIASGARATVGGGSYNRATARSATVGGGATNSALGEYATIGGGHQNNAPTDFATVGGGQSNVASGRFAAVGGGTRNRVSANSATIGGGFSNTASGRDATVGGGRSNTASGILATVPGGGSNSGIGDHSFAAGRRAVASHDGAFVWGDGYYSTQNPTLKTSSVADEFNVYASGGVRLFTNSAATTGVLLAPGGSTWTMVSDRDAKENVDPVDARAVLDEVARLPLATWNYKDQDDSIRHMGPMAQDFYAAFGLGLGEKTIDTIDPNGVALAAIQGLNELVQDENAALKARLAEKEAEIDELREQIETIAALPAELAALESRVAALAARLEDRTAIR